ncbi:hypothetical protein HPP92_008408 [Vanilla planifolia]|uniref:Uncharacterized protein n=1 Tax=Vanilla planifolia TaxID=51239 RepID=A0A835V1Y2_VANPL|nr:hypothetical protein HPP92_008408 [Vanilla planifolia]
MVIQVDLLPSQALCWGYDLGQVLTCAKFVQLSTAHVLNEEYKVCQVEQGIGNKLYKAMMAEHNHEIMSINKLRKPPLLPNFHGLRVLLVDDDDILRLHKELLSKVTSVSSGFHCLNSLAPPSIPAVDSALHVPQMDGFSRHEDRKRKLGVGHQSFFDKQAPRRMHWCCPAEQG